MYVCRQVHIYFTEKIMQKAKGNKAKGKMRDGRAALKGNCEYYYDFY